MKKLLATLVVALGAAGLTACNQCCDPCSPGPMVYKKPCCAGQTMPPPPPPGRPVMVQPGPSGTMPAPAPAPRSSCGSGKCG